MFASHYDADHNAEYADGYDYGDDDEVVEDYRTFVPFVATFTKAAHADAFAERLAGLVGGVDVTEVTHRAGRRTVAFTATYDAASSTFAETLGAWAEMVGYYGSPPLGRQARLAWDGGAGEVLAPRSY